MNKDRCSNNNIQCHLTINLDELESDRIELIKDMKKYKKSIEKWKKSDKYIIFLLILGLLLIITSLLRI